MFAMTQTREHSNDLGTQALMRATNHTVELVGQLPINADLLCSFSHPRSKSEVYMMALVITSIQTWKHTQERSPDIRKRICFAARWLVRAVHCVGCSFDN